MERVALFNLLPSGIVSGFSLVFMPPGRPCGNGPGDPFSWLCSRDGRMSLLQEHVTFSPGYCLFRFP